MNGKTYDNTNKGVLFINDKDGNEKRPDWRGSLNVAGQEFWLSAWVREKRESGEEYLQLSIEPKQSRDVGGARGPAPAARPRPNARPQSAQQPKQDDFDDDIPY